MDPYGMAAYLTSSDWEVGLRMQHI